jgi:hypothetical protein
MSEINDLMNLDPLSLSKSKEARGKMILYFRKMRSGGVKPKKVSEDIDVEQVMSLLGIEKPPTVVIPQGFKKRF